MLAAKMCTHQDDDDEDVVMSAGGVMEHNSSEGSLLGNDSDDDDDLMDEDNEHLIPGGLSRANAAKLKSIFGKITEDCRPKPKRKEMRFDPSDKEDLK